MKILVAKPISLDIHRALRRQSKERSKEYLRKTGVQLGGSEERYLDTITDADNRRSLLNRLAELGDIKHPDGHVYHVVDMLDIIRRLKGVDDPNLLKVTRTYGLRDKVSFILEKEQLE